MLSLGVQENLSSFPGITFFSSSKSESGLLPGLSLASSGPLWQARVSCSGGNGGEAGGDAGSRHVCSPESTGK